MKKDKKKQKKIVVPKNRDAFLALKRNLCNHIESTETLQDLLIKLDASMIFLEQVYREQISIEPEESSTLKVYKRKKKNKK